MLVVRVASAHSIAAGCAQTFGDAGADVAMTHLNETAKTYVQPVADAVEAKLLLPLDVEAEGQMDAVFAVIKERWGRLDVLVQSIAFCVARDLHGLVVDFSLAGFAQAMDISVHSLIRMARGAEPLMTKDATVLTMTYYGGDNVVDHYNIMGPVKAALEGAVRALAVELGLKGIRVNAISPAPLQARAGFGIAHLDELIDSARRRAPEQTLITIKDVDDVAVLLTSDGMGRVTGDVTYADGGLHVRA